MNHWRTLIYNETHRINFCWFIEAPVFLIIEVVVVVHSNWGQFFFSSNVPQADFPSCSKKRGLLIRKSDLRTCPTVSHCELRFRPTLLAHSRRVKTTYYEIRQILNQIKFNEWSEVKFVIFVYRIFSCIKGVFFPGLRASTKTSWYGLHMGTWVLVHPKQGSIFLESAFYETAPLFTRGRYLERENYGHWDQGTRVAWIG